MQETKKMKEGGKDRRRMPEGRKGNLNFLKERDNSRRAEVQAQRYDHMV